MAEPVPGLVWARERPQPSRRAPSVEQIVARSVAIADADGLAGVTMRRIAAELRSGTASLYRYVTNRDELVDLMVDAVQGEAEPQPPTGNWRADLSAVARRQRLVLLRHPWLSGELTGRPSLGPNTMRQAEAAMTAALELTPDVTLAVNVVESLTAYVLGAVASELAELQAQRRTGLTEAQWQASVGPYVRRLIDSGEYPNLARRVLEADDDATPEERFEFGLSCVLDGAAARVR
jgi:AcrR family transcriptional regulator